MANNEQIVCFGKEIGGFEENKWQSFQYSQQVKKKIINKFSYRNDHFFHISTCDLETSNLLVQVMFIEIIHQY